ncbi:hypothetical protein F7725_006900 [Dissostichus mawsoni]|uniref:LIM zinc-binding domain-containing protein n=1 Tax=Dissostichus mawsoni TaxID=36200 RepID=A0A7J5XY56_DISMA|nr:hypothetical protein F7725_006900 [Dissostichus mawsoni]
MFESCWKKDKSKGFEMMTIQYQSGLYGENNNSSSPISSRGNSPIVCERCGEVCLCGCDLVHSGFFHHSGEYICTEDYQRLHGTQCDSCSQYITGEVVSALGRTYHPHCFVCSICRSPFPIGDRVTFCGKKCVFFSLVLVAPSGKDSLTMRTGTRDEEERKEERSDGRLAGRQGQKGGRGC